MSGDSDPRWDDPRDRVNESRDVEVHWIKLERGPASDRQPENDTRDRDDDERARIRERLGLPPRTCLVTFVGFWSREKAPDVLFAAWQQARRRTNADVSLLFMEYAGRLNPDLPSWSGGPDGPPLVLLADRTR